ncbi:hypothetical protein D3C72_2041030 [compost metagenome]
MTATLPLLSRTFAISSPALTPPVKLSVPICEVTVAPLAGTSTVITLMPAFSAFSIAARTPWLSTGEMTITSTPLTMKSSTSASCLLRSWLAIATSSATFFSFASAFIASASSM